MITSVFGPVLRLPAAFTGLRLRPLEQYYSIERMHRRYPPQHYPAPEYSDTTHKGSTSEVPAHPVRSWGKRDREVGMGWLC